MQSTWFMSIQDRILFKYGCHFLDICFIAPNTSVYNAYPKNFIVNQNVRYISTNLLYRNSYFYKKLQLNLDQNTFKPRNVHGFSGYNVLLH